jgi:hypothetical protein
MVEFRSTYDNLTKLKRIPPKDLSRPSALTDRLLHFGSRAVMSDAANR